MQIQHYTAASAQASDGNIVLHVLDYRDQKERSAGIGDANSKNMRTRL